MAIRPLFRPAEVPSEYVTKNEVEFTWHPGTSRQQKQKSVRALHDAGKAKLGITRILEISSKSELVLGRQLSAFNLDVVIMEGRRVSVECAFQGSKVFENGGPYTDLYFVDSPDAKRDPRLKESGNLVSFRMNEQDWPLEPMTLFYDWLYLSGLNCNEAFATELIQYEGFTDIEFNPKKSVNCQARSAALYVKLASGGWLESVLETPEAYKKVMGVNNGVALTTAGGQLDLFDK